LHRKVFALLASVREYLKLLDSICGSRRSREVAGKGEPPVQRHEWVSQEQVMRN